MGAAVAVSCRDESCVCEVYCVQAVYLVSVGEGLCVLGGCIPVMSLRGNRTFV
jgi:hypothetical protein